MGVYVIIDATEEDESSEEEKDNINTAAQGWIALDWVGLIVLDVLDVFDDGVMFRECGPFCLQTAFVWLE